MKFNFWQILGAILLIAGVAFLIYEKTGVRPATPVEPVAQPIVLPPPTAPAPATMP